jgi:hypothetical protein
VSSIKGLKEELAECLKVINLRTQEVVDLKNQRKQQRCTTCGTWTHCWIQDASISGYGEERPDDVWCERWTPREDGV